MMKTPEIRFHRRDLMFVPIAIAAVVLAGQALDYALTPAPPVVVDWRAEFVSGTSFQIEGNKTRDCGKPVEFQAEARTPYGIVDTTVAFSDIVESRGVGVQSFGTWTFKPLDEGEADAYRLTYMHECEGTETEGETPWLVVTK